MGKSNKNSYSVYLHYFPDGKSYIGITKRKPELRWGKDGNGYIGQPVYEAILKYGWENVDHYILATGVSKEDARFMEQDYIEMFDSIDNGYNKAKGGCCGGDAWTKIEYNNNWYTPEELLKFSTVDSLTEHDLTTRINHHGWDVERALTQPKQEKNKMFLYNGEYYSAKQLAEMSPVEGICPGDIYMRINFSGWDIERALTQPKNVKLQPRGLGEKTYEYNGQLYNSYELEQLSTVDGLTAHNIVHRINIEGWSVEKAITTPKKRRNIKFEYNGKMYTSHELAELSPLDNITYHDITDRIRAGWTVEDAILKPKR